MTHYQKYHKGKEYIKTYEQTEKRKASKRPYSRLYYLQNKEKHKKVVAIYLKAHLELGRNASRRRYAREQGAEGTHTFKKWQELKKQCDYTCLMCKRKEPEIKLTEDHIVPLSRDGTDYIDNIQPLCQSCNSKKYTQILYLI